jgi:riboflavin biosynthesis pyrimidine reductase
MPDAGATRSDPRCARLRALLFNRLTPDPEPVDDADLPALFDFAALAPPDRPYLVLNMVASADGRATLEGVTEQLSSPADKAMFFALRASVDAVLAGTGTLRAERYGRIIKRPERRAQREALGLAPEPLAPVLSRSGDVPRDIPLFEDPEARPLVLVGEDAEPRRALELLAAEHGVRSVLCEGGPRLNAGLLAAGVVDELFLTISPMLAATPEPLTIIEGHGAPVALDLVSVLEAESMLFLRYQVVRG